MEPERWQRIEQLYYSALELVVSQRAAFVENACRGDGALYQEVTALLAQADASDGFLEAPAMDAAAKAMAGERPMPAAIGRYRVMRLLGEGGMGCVYEAEQDQPRRTVALKVIKPGFATPETLRRFQHESQALGRLQHPGIAQIYEASTADTGFGPQPYFAMELIVGQALHEFAPGRRLTTRERLELMAKVCDAVEHAHQRGVIHRDLKPGNILVDETGQPKVLDFGVARVTDRDAPLTRQTDLGQLVGTLAYMSPEQVLGDPLAVDSRSDVYTLGVILYQLLADKLPYDIHRKPLPEAVAVIQQEEPAPLSSISRSYRGDIATIVAKALEKDKSRRYGSAAELASDIRRHLADEPIAARPASATYQMQKFARRHKALVAGAAAVLVVLAAGVVASGWEAVRARRAERGAVEQRDRAVTAERAATAERDRSVAAEARAQQERNAALSEKHRADAEAATAQAVNDFLQNDLLAQASVVNQSGPSANLDPDLKVRTALDRAAARITGKFAGQPEVEAAIRDTIGQTYIALGLRHDGLNQLQQALELRRRVLGVENPKTLETMDHLGGVVGSLDAMALFSQTLRVRRRVLGPEHPNTLTSLDGLANAYEAQGKYAQAEALDTQILKIRRRVLGPQHPDTMISMNTLAIVYNDEGKFSQAELLISQALDISRRVLGLEHAATLNYMNTLAATYDNQGKFAQAEALYKPVLEIQRRLLGPEHPATLVSMTNLANVYDQQGKHAPAEALYNPALEISRRVLGPEHPRTLVYMSNLAEIYETQGNYSGAEALHGEILQIRRRVLGPEHPDTLESLSDIASLYLRQGKYALAETYGVQALVGQRHVLGSEHPYTMDSAADLALAYQAQGKFAESESLAREAVEIDRKKRPDDWQRFRAESLLGASLAGGKKYAAAEPLLLDGYQGMVARKDRIAVPDRYHLDRASEWVVQLYESWGKPEKVAEWSKK